MSADLRAAATLLRQRAAEAICPCGGPVCNIERGGIRHGEMRERLYGWERATSHYAALTPAVAVALADWLDAEFDHQFGPSEQAITVAQTYLGGGVMSAETLPCSLCGYPCASVEDFVAGRAPYRDSPGGHRDRHALVVEAAERIIEEAS